MSIDLKRPVVPYKLLYVTPERMAGNEAVSRYSWEDFVANIYLPL